MCLNSLINQYYCVIINWLYLSRLLSGNPYRCAPGLQWLQSWTSSHHVVQDINDVTCTTLNGGKAKLAEYDFNQSGKNRDSVICNK